METDMEKRLNALEDDFKLIKGEIRSTVMNMRDYVTELKVMPSKEDFDAIDPGKPDSAPASSKQIPLSPGPDNIPTDMVPSQAAEERAPKEPSYQAPEPAPEKPAPQEATMKPVSGKPARLEPADLKDEPPAPEPEEPTFGDEMPEAGNEPEEASEETAEMSRRPDKSGEGKPEKNERPAAAPLSEINPLVNLISWVARAKRELGKEQLITLLEVYTLGAPLSRDLRDTILNLAEIVEDGAAESIRAADIVRKIHDGLTGIFESYAVEGKLPEGLKEAAFRLIDNQNLPHETEPSTLWGRLILELHGILAGNEALFASRRTPNPQDKTPEADEPAEKPESPFKLKLILPTGGGQEKEFVLNLASPEPAGRNGNDNGHNGNDHNGNGHNGNGNGNGNNKNGNRNLFRN